MGSWGNSWFQLGSADAELWIPIWTQMWKHNQTSVTFMVLVEALYFLFHSMVIPTNLPDGGVS